MASSSSSSLSAGILGRVCEGEGGFADDATQGWTYGVTHGGTQGVTHGTE